MQVENKNEKKGKLLDLGVFSQYRAFNINTLGNDIK